MEEKEDDSAKGEIGPYREDLPMGHIHNIHHPEEE